ncbi:MAG: DUF2125 domain-containing protein [Alphaproteobacteria bacterium]|nr:DUF2125 domain-containing protein [Alphaproteobacteria bacterium]
MIRRRPLRVATVAFGMLALWGLGWFAVALYIEQRALGWIEGQRAAGTMMEAQRLAIDGFPFAWRLAADDYVIDQGGDGAQRVSGKRLEASFLPWRLRDIPLRLPGEHRFERRDAAGGFAIVFEAERPDARLLLASTGRMQRLELDFGTLTLRIPSLASTLTATRAQLVARDIDPPDPRSRDFWNLTLSLDDVTTPATWVTPFSRPMRRASLEIGVRGERVRAATPAEALIAWRDAAGVVELRDLAIDWTPLTVNGSGSGGLDRQNRPEAALSLRISGYDELLNALVQSRQVSRGQATAIRIALTALARANPQTNRNEVQLPITAQNGELTILGFPVAKLPPLALPR